MNKKELVLNAALTLFVKQGFHGTATAKIAAEAGVANGTLFQYFKTKDDLILALFLAIKEDMKFQMIAFIHWALVNGDKFQFIQQYYNSPYIHQLNTKDLEKYLQPHYVIIEKGIKEGVIKKIPTDLLYALISNQTFGLYQFLMAKKRSKIKQQEIIQLTFDMLWEMIALK
jgi:DNA-binding transcriptional regulator YbjK